MSEKGLTRTTELRQREGLSPGRGLSTCQGTQKPSHAKEIIKLNKYNIRENKEMTKESGGEDLGSVGDTSAHSPRTTMEALSRIKPLKEK